jgi:hypothetical protein
MQLAPAGAVQIPMTAYRPSQFAYRILLGCAYESQFPEAYGILLMRHRPRGVKATVHDIWPRYAPSHFLITGRLDGDRLDAPTRRGGNLHLGWEAFATAYRGELDALGESVRQAIRVELAMLLRFKRRVVLLSSERPLLGIEVGARTQRRIFKDWVLDRALDLRDLSM